MQASVPTAGHVAGFVGVDARHPPAGLTRCSPLTSSTISTHSQRKRGLPMQTYHHHRRADASRPHTARRRQKQRTAAAGCHPAVPYPQPPAGRAAPGRCRHQPGAAAIRGCQGANGRGVTCSLPPAKTCKGRFPTTSPGPCAARCSTWRRCSAAVGEVRLPLPGGCQPGPPSRRHPPGRAGGHGCPGGIGGHRRDAAARADRSTG